MPCACWSTRPTALSTSRSDPAARMSRLLRSKRPTPSGGRRDTTSRAPARARPMSTVSAASASSASSCVAGRRRMPRRARSSSRDRRRVDLDRRRQIEPALEPVEARGDQPADREVRVAARVRRLQLRVRRRLLHAVEDRGDADRRLAVVVAPARERARPVLRDDAVVRVEARRRQAAQRRAGARARRRGTRAPRPRADRRRPRRGSGCARRPRARSGCARRCRRRRATASARATRRARAARRRRGSSRARGPARPPRGARVRAAVEISCWPCPSSA